MGTENKESKRKPFYKSPLFRDISISAGFLAAVSFLVYSYLGLGTRSQVLDQALQPPIVTQVTEPAVTVTVNTIPTVPARAPFEISDPYQDLTAEQIKNAMEDWKQVLDFYGLQESEVSIRFRISSEGHIDITTYYQGREGGAVKMGRNSFVTEREGLRHEIGHALNYVTIGEMTRLPDWFDEGLADYVSGVIDDETGGISLYSEDGREYPNGSINKIYPKKEAWELMKQNPENFWRRIDRNDNYVVGGIFYRMLLDLDPFIPGANKLTPEKNAVAIREMHKGYVEDSKLDMIDIQRGYETALDTNLDYVFDLLKPAFNY